MTITSTSTITYTIQPMTSHPNYLSDTQMSLRPGFLDLGLGHPDPTLLPVAAMQRATTRILETLGGEALSYGWAAGPGPLADWLRARMARNEGRAPAQDELLITAGNSHALDQLLTLHTKPGDVALVETPTYHLAVRILKDHPLQLVPVPTDDEGPRLDALKEALVALKREGKLPRLLYTVPTFHNPTGRSWHLSRRLGLIELATDTGFLIVEDDVYRELAYDAPAPPSLWSLAPTGVVARLGSFSKSLSPGLRLGWLTAGASLIHKHTSGGLMDSGGGVNQFTAMAVSALCAAGDFDGQVARFRSAYRERRDALLKALSEHAPSGCNWQVPGGGFFVWLALPDGVRSDALLARAESLGVSFVLGVRPCWSGGGENALRLAFSLYAPEELAEAVRRLGEAMKP
jgi:DNA-binding transcriptional MocR family regulator